MYPERLKHLHHSSSSTDTSSTATINQQFSNNWSLSLRIKKILKFYSFLLLSLIFSLAILRGFPSQFTTAIAWVLGIFSMVLSIFQFIPQIHQTLNHKVHDIILFYYYFYLLRKSEL